MALIKNEIPILEYDTEPQAVIMPARKKLYSFPSKAVFLFLFDEVERFAAANGCVEIGEFVSITKKYPIYKYVYRNHEICLCQAPMGAAAAVQILDFLIGYGVKEIVSAGTCGALVDLPENKMLIPIEALRDEGTSYHYLPPERTVKINEKATRAIARALEKQSIEYEFCKTWTTDGFYRETADMVRHRKAEGCTVVDMECSGLAACAEFRGVVFGQLLFTADTLANVEAHDDRDWGMDSFSIALSLALDAVCEI